MKFDITALNNGEVVEMDQQTWDSLKAQAERRDCYVEYWDGTGGIAEFVYHLDDSPRPAGFWITDNGLYLSLIHI